MNTNGWLSSNRIGFTGQEDLGAGWKAIFQLETGFNLSNGALDNTSGLLFNRMSYVGVKGPYGTLTLGRQWNLAHDMMYDFDPFFLQYPGIVPLTPALDGIHFSNNAKYKGEFGPFKVSFENSFGGVAGNFNEGSARSAGMQYKSGFFEGGAVYIHRSVLVGANYVPDNYYALGTRLTFGPLMVSGGYMNENQAGFAGSNPVRTENYWGGATYDITGFTRVGGGVYITNLPNTNGKRNLGIVSVTHSLSKRTLLYAEVDYTRFSGSYVTNTTLNPQKAQHQIGATVGIDHNF
jgi:predicted porin